MPKVELPKTVKGWVMVLASSFVGFVSGTVALNWMAKVWK